MIKVATPLPWSFSGGESGIHTSDQRGNAIAFGGSGTHTSDQGGDASIWSLLGEEVYTPVIKVARQVFGLCWGKRYTHK